MKDETKRHISTIMIFILRLVSLGNAQVMKNGAL